MDCLRSFTIRINQQLLCTNANGVVKTWGTAGDYYFSADNTPLSLGSKFDLTGFKNTDIYGASVTGIIKGDPNSVNAKCIVSNWSFKFFLDGQTPLVSGAIDPTVNSYNLFVTSPNANFLTLSKDTPCIMFSNPFKSVKSIRFDGTLIEGYGAEFLNLVAVLYDLSFTFYYKYEGE